MTNSHNAANYLEQKWFYISKARYEYIQLLIFIMLAASSVALASNYVGTANGQPETNFPPPIFYQLRSEPSYVIDIPFNSMGYR